MQLSVKGVQAIEEFFQAYQLDGIIFIGDPEQLGKDGPLKFSIMLKRRKNPSQSRLKGNSRGYRMKTKAGSVMVERCGESIEVTAKLPAERVAIPGIWGSGETGR